ncbi:MAG: T9SS type A sorting domain-containing protein [Bacteroidales bacterium]|nr:T9SS type A sorting domain-containing protein [Bacteroidales bacterium]
MELLNQSGTYTLSVYSLTGTQVFETIINNHSSGIHEINLSSLSSGFYVIKLESEEFSRFKKIIIEK